VSVATAVTLPAERIAAYLRYQGYATPGHRAALRAVGPSPHHRLSWRLGVDQPDDDVEGQDGALIVLQELQELAIDLESLEREQTGRSQEVHA